MSTHELRVTPQGEVAPADSTEWRLVGGLTAIAMLAMFDKYALSLLVQPVKASLSLTDAEIGLAVSAAFALANIAASLPAGWLADRGDRRKIVAFGVVLWSTATALCAASWNFWSFFCARAAVGFGEGLIPPASYSLLRDGAGAKNRARAFGIYAAANTFGPGIALLSGGLIVSAIAAWHIDHLPLIGAVKPWQVTLFLSGCFGLPLAGLAFMFPDPARARIERPESTSLRAAIRVISGSRGAFLSLVVYSCAVAMTSSAYAIWFPALIVRQFHLGLPQIGLYLGLMLVTLGPIGVLASGVLIDRLSRTGRDGASIVALATSVILTGCAAFAPIADSQAAMWILEGGVLLTSTSYLCVVSSVVANIAPREMMGKLMAGLLVTQGLLGVGAAPAIVGFLADHLTGGTSALSTALALTTGATALVSILGALALRSFLGRRVAMAAAAREKVRR